MACTLQIKNEQQKEAFKRSIIKVKPSIWIISSIMMTIENERLFWGWQSPL